MYRVAHKAKNPAKIRDIFLDEVYTDHIFFILNLSVDIDCFHALAITNRAAMNTEVGVHVSFRIMFF